MSPTVDPNDRASGSDGDIPDDVAAHDVPSDDALPRLVDRTISWSAFVALITTAVVALLWWPAARLDFYFDEMWRVEIVRSSTPVSAYLAGPAPIPPGWVLALSSVFDVVPDRRPLLRLAAASLAIPAAVLLAIAVRQLLTRRFTPLVASSVASIAAPLTITAPALAIHLTYFNNYMTDIAVASTIIWALTSLDDPSSDSMRPWWALLALSLLAPWFAQGALFLLPGAAVVVYRRATGHRTMAYACAIVAGCSSSVVALAFLRPVANGATLTDYWRLETPAIGFVGFVRRFFTTFIDSAYPQAFADRPFAIVSMVGFTALGAVVVHRACRWWLPLFASSAAIAIGAAITTGWPATFVRSNSSFQILLFVLAPIGIGVTVVRVAMRLRSAAGSSFAAGVGVLAIGLAIAAVWAPQSIRSNSASGGVFARGLTDDVASVAVRLRQGDVVVAYHLSGPYVRDRVLNADDVARSVAVVDEARVGELTDLSAWTHDETGSIWCVVPFEAGPDATDAACPPSAEWSTATTETGRRATLIELVRVR